FFLHAMTKTRNKISSILLVIQVTRKKKVLSEERLLFNQSGAPNRSLPDDDKIFISVVYSVVCAVGLVGNLLVFYLMRLRQGRKRSTINVFIINLVAGEKLCLLKFPEGHDWLALYHIQKILIAFIIPMLIVSVNYLMLLRFVRRKSMDTSNPKRRSRVTKSVAIVVLSFFCCWMPNHAITFWGVLVKFNAANWDTSYYTVHTYVFPLTVCLAHTNSCLNPVLYCLMRPEIRKMLGRLFWRDSTPLQSKGCATRSVTQGEIQGVVPLRTSKCAKTHSVILFFPFAIYII
uniref:G-protein coupled receptors family 1 profile domain-containing protein n=1 Tax=Oryzias latipes TaxID=8090 RepID=A0A3B3HNE4_ORYLA